jgi:hypothetical protein
MPFIHIYKNTPHFCTISVFDTGEINYWAESWVEPNLEHADFKQVLAPILAVYAQLVEILRFF